MRSTRRAQERKGSRRRREPKQRPTETVSASKPSNIGDAGLALVRVQYAATAEPLGSMPPLPNPKAHTGEVPLSLLLDKLGERLAFERSGVRLYDALLSKFDAFGSWKHGPSRAELEYIRGQEKEHFLLLHLAIGRLGGDPTALTPSADLHAVASKGLSDVLTDPRTTLSQGLEAILMAELLDNDSWRSLADLAASRAEDDLVDQCERAIQTESEHLFKVRSWLGAFLGTIAEEKKGASRRAPAPAARRKRATPKKRTSPRAALGRGKRTKKTRTPRRPQRRTR